MSEVGKRIRKRRLELGLSQDELARLVDYKSRTSINKIEVPGGYDLPQRKIVQFAVALQTTPGYLLGWEDCENARRDFISDLCDSYEKLNDNAKNKIREYLADLLSNPKNLKGDDK